MFSSLDSVNRLGTLVDGKNEVVQGGNQIKALDTKRSIAQGDAKVV